MQKLLLTLLATISLSSCAQMDAMRDAQNQPAAKPVPSTATSGQEAHPSQLNQLPTTPAASPAMENAHKAISY